MTAARWRQRGKKLQHLTAAKLLPDNDLLGRIDTVDLEHTFLAISKPIVVICMWTAPYVVCSKNHLTAIRRRERAPSTTSNYDLAFGLLCQLPPGCGQFGPGAALASALDRAYG